MLTDEATCFACRGKERCEHCDGTGIDPDYEPGYSDPDDEDCFACDGDGRCDECRKEESC